MFMLCAGDVYGTVGTSFGFYDFSFNDASDSNVRQQLKLQQQQ